MTISALIATSIKRVVSRLSSGSNICHSVRCNLTKSRHFVLSASTFSVMAAVPNVVFVLGAPGAGKGTQCQKIVEEFGYVHLSAGELLREERKLGGKVAAEVEKHMQEGTIVPVAITCGLLEKSMNQFMAQENKRNFLIDGFPRNQDNLDGWNQAMAGKANVQFVLFFDVSDEVGVNRAIQRGMEGSGREDDNLNSLKKRIHTYKEATMPIVEHYRNLSLLKMVDGTPSVDKVYAEVKQLFL